MDTQNKANWETNYATSKLISRYEPRRARWNTEMAMTAGTQRQAPVVD